MNKEYTRKELSGFSPYELNKEEKQAYYRHIMKDMTAHHYSACKEYHNLLDFLKFDISKEHEVEEYPFLPVRLFKEFDLRSIPENEIVKTMTSSGTTGQRVSKIYLDKESALRQSTTLVSITKDMLGGKRFPMLIIDTKSVVKDRKKFSARGAGILGFSMLGKDTTYALDEDMNLNFDEIEAFLDRHKDEKILLFGFTYIIWQHLYKVLKTSGMKLDFSNGILLHGGGFKKLADEAVDNETYKKRLYEVCGITRICNYYGMVEQTGSIFMECECGRLHASNYSDIIIRNPDDFSVCKTGQRGLIELISVLPDSYPGHVLLSEDLGTITGEDDCPCGRKGKTFEIYGRIQKAEVRGCSDTYGK
ncbi:MAG: acyl-protein synthetase [Lachnospiraceae bacterium]